MNAPSKPKTDPDLGTNTPKYVEWMLKYADDAEWEKSYGQRTRTSMAMRFGITITDEKIVELAAEAEQTDLAPVEEAALVGNDEPAEEVSNTSEAESKEEAASGDSPEVVDQADAPTEEALADLEADIPWQTFKEKHGLTQKQYREKYNLEK